MFGESFSLIWDSIKKFLNNFFDGLSEAAETYSSTNAEVAANIEKLPPLAQVANMDQINGTNMLGIQF